MALVNTERNFIYLFEPNTRSTLVENTLKGLEGSSVIAGDRYKSLYTLLNDEDITLEQANTYRIVCTVRNPYDSFISRCLKARPGMTVENFLDDSSLSRRKPLVLQPGNGMYEEASDFVWFEYMIGDIYKLFGRVITRPKPTHRSGVRNAMWQDYYEGKPFKHILQTSAACRRYMRRFGYQITRDETRLTSKVNMFARDSFVVNRKQI